MNVTAQQIADILEGDIIGNALVSVNKLAKIEEGVSGSITFLSNPKYNHYIYTTKASIVIVNKTFNLTEPVSATLILVEDSYLAFTKLLEYYNQIKLMKSGIEQPSVI